MPDRPQTARAQARVQTIEQIKASARRHMAADGANLSLRAVARDLGMVSSAVYRYFESRDDLLTALILDGYAAMGEAVEEADAVLPRREVRQRWAELWRETRDWARAHPHEYALLYGTPVPGYAAPAETVGQAQRVLVVGMEILGEAAERNLLVPPAERLPKAVRAEVETIGTVPGFDRVPTATLSRALTAWATLYGTISFELFGRYNNAIEDLDAFYDHQVRAMARYVGLNR